MRLWLLFILFVAVACALYMGFGSPEYGEKAAEIFAEIEDK